jgi:hypothetical protein
MKTNITEQDALSSAAANAAIQDAYNILGFKDREAVRAAHWIRLPLAARRVAVMCANLPKERADDALDKFNAFERGQINLAVIRLMRDLEQVKKAMQGGEVPAAAGVYSH